MAMRRRMHPVYHGRYLFETPCERVTRHIREIRWQITDAKRTGGEADWIRELNDRLRELRQRKREDCG